MLPSPHALPPPQATTWTPHVRKLTTAVTDGQRHTYELLRPTAAGQDPCDLGLQWPHPVRIGSVIVEFASLGGRSFEPDPRATRVEVWEEGRWKPVRADVLIDTSRVGEIAPIQIRGNVRWTFRFEPVDASRVRVYMSAPAHRDLAYQCIAVTEITALPGNPYAPQGRIERRGPSLDPPPFLHPGGNLAVRGAGARVQLGNPWTATWIRPMTVTEVRAARTARITRVEWSYGSDWRTIEPIEPRADGSVTFPPHCVTGIRVTFADRAPRDVVVAGGPEAADYYEAVRASRTDMLGERFRAAEKRDLVTMHGLLQPIDFAKTAIGRPEDLVETMVGWTGAFYQISSGAPRDPASNAPLPAQALDRWFAPAPLGRPPDWFHTHAAYLDGWLPAVVTHFEHPEVRTTETVFVTAPGAPIYGAVAMVELRNLTDQPRRVRFDMAMGARRIYDNPATPFTSDPLETGYRLDRDHRTVRDEAGRVALHAWQTGRVGGTPRELHLSNTITLEPHATGTLTYFVPDVTAPMTEVEPIAGANPYELLREFREYWRKAIGPARTLELPEAGLADALRNLLAQCMIIGLDGPVARYGAYHYESYFGLEEGWTAVAMAQFGLADVGRKVMDYMLSDECLDKANYHHQYRNGLAPWYAADISRLAPDRAWLEEIAPTLRRCADWTIATISANQDPKWGGILPRHAYGGDIGMPAYSFYSNATCWRGLYDTAILMEMLGDADAGRRYRDAAERYRSRLIELADALADRTNDLTFLPVSFGLIQDGRERDREPSYAVLASDVPYSDLWVYLGNYWNLFAPCLQELRLFPVSDPRSQWIPSYMDARGGIAAGQVRFANGLDAVYGKGYIQSLLDSGRREDFLTSLYGLFSAAMSRHLYSNPEVSGLFPLRTGALPMYRENARERWFWSYRYGGAWAQGWQSQEGEPLAAGAGMAVQILRMAIVREDYAQDPPTSLRIFDGVPSHWFDAGRRIVCPGMATFFGVLDLETEARADGAAIRITPHGALTAEELRLRIPAPNGRKLQRAAVNGVPIPVTHDGIVIPRPDGPVQIIVSW